VEQVEAGELDSALTRARVAAVVQPLLQENIDHIALGCTHYPFLSPLIRELTGEQIALYDPAEAIARRVDSLLQLHGSDSMATTATVSSPPRRTHSPWPACCHC
jgi:glutamate racemase